MRIDKNYILSEIKRTALENGAPLGRDRFASATGIKESDWLGKYWARWSDALVEAGYRPNKLQGAYEEEFLLEKLAGLVREFGHFPARTEIQLRSQGDSTLPNAKTYQRLGTKKELVSKLIRFCELKSQYKDVLGICTVLTELSDQPTTDSKATNVQIFGHVYLLRSGRFYKIGRSNSVGRRERELAIQLPEKAKVVHSMATDDPQGIEDYWHRRFADRRKNGEWFELTGEDVSAFRRRKFM